MKTRRITLRLCLVAVLLLCSAQARAYEPTSSYTPVQLHGFTVLVSAAFEGHPTDKALVLEELNFQLSDIIRTVPADIVDFMRGVRIWLEHDQPLLDGSSIAYYFGQRGTLTQNGLNPDKYRDISIVKARSFVFGANATGRWLMLHELAHGYHDQILGYDDPRIIAAYDRAVQSGLYKGVDYILGSTVASYALANVKEFFAVLTAAYFGREPWYPFDRTDLMAYDPQTHALLQQILGEPRTPGLFPDNQPELGGATLSGAPTLAQFKGGASADQGTTYDSAFSAQETIDVMATIEIAPEHVGQIGRIFVVAIYENIWLYKRGSNAWQLWNLVPADLNLHLGPRILLEKEAVSVIHGLRGLRGNFFIFIGYKPGTDTIHFNPQPIAFSVM